MHSALLAVLMLGNLPVFLYPQTALPDATWPTHATLTLPKGWLAPDQHLSLTENGQPMLAQFEVASRWPDGTAKWVHAHGTFRYQGSKPAEYAAQRTHEAVVVESPLRVRDEPAGIDIDNGEIRLRIERPFKGISQLEVEGQSVVSGVGGPYVIDADGTLWHAQHDRDAEIIVEQQGPAMVVVKAVGWYQTPEPRDDAFCRFTTRVTVYAESNLIKFDHATTFADDMKKHQIAELGFKFALPGATSFASETHRGRFHEQLHAAYLAQLSDDRLYRIAQTGPDAERDIRHQGDFERSAGWFSTTVGSHTLALLTKDFWQKCPKEVKFSPHELIYYAWPRHGDLSPPDPTATQIHNIYKFRCFHTGRLLDSRVPPEYLEALGQQSDTMESKPEFAAGGNMQGVSMRNEFALEAWKASDDTGERVAARQQLYLQNPIARFSPQAVAASGVFGRTRGADPQFAEMEDVVVRGVLGGAGSIPRYRDYGWAIYGNLHHGQIMDYKVDGQRVGRPSLHRVWNNNHYQQCSTLWHVWALNGDARLLQMARLLTDNYGSIGLVRFDKQWHQTPVDSADRRPGIRSHVPGSFYHCKAFVPWGGVSYEMGGYDDHLALWGHFPDPSGLLYAWLLDADRWSLDGYQLWRSNVRFRRGGTRREINQSLVQAMDAHEFAPSDDSLEAIRGMLFGSDGRGGLTGTPIEQQRPGPLWNPLWVSRAYEMFPEHDTLKAFVVRSADSLGALDEGVWTLALSATAWEITKDTKYLTQHGGTLERMRRRLTHDPTGRWQNFGASPGRTGDNFFALQWHRFTHALHHARLALPESPLEPGQYFASTARFDDPRDAELRGTRVLILGPDPAADTQLTIDANRFMTGGMPPASISLFDPAGKRLWHDPRMAITGRGGARYYRPSTWQAVRDSYPGPSTPGLHTLLYASQGLGVFQGVAGGLPECQILRSVRLANSTREVKYACTLSKGWLVPLVNLNIVLRFSPMSKNRDSYVAITPRDGNKQERWLIPGDSLEILLEEGNGPWYLDVFGDGSSATRLEVHSQVDVPLLYGQNLAHVEQVKQVLLPESRQRSVPSSR